MKMVFRSALNLTFSPWEKGHRSPTLGLRMILRQIQSQVF
jgi:hypothetical protein